jgi:hypothetical protein
MKHFEPDGSSQIGSVLKLTTWLLATLLITLPFSEWKFIGLPLRGRPLFIDSDQYLSASVFDVVYIILAIASLPILWNWVRARKYRNPALIHWLIGLVLVAVVWSQLQPTLPFLTPSSRNVVDTRTLLYCVSISIVLGVLVSELALKTLLKALSIFFVGTVIGFAVLSVLALTEFSYFHLHYPFSNPASITFPFPNQNYAAPFITLSLLGMLGVGASTGNRTLLVLAPSVLIPAALLTGSRSNLLMLTFACLVSFAAYVFYWRRHQNMLQRPCPNPMFQVAGLILAVLLVLPHSNWLTIQRALSIFQDIAAKPSVVLTAQPGSPRAEMWSRAMTPAAEQGSGNISSRSESNKFGLALVSVKNGCKAVSNLIPGLLAGRNYKIVLEIAPSPINGPMASLAIWDEDTSAKPFGALNSPWGGAALPNLYLFAADSGSKFVISQGAVRNFNLVRNGTPIADDPLSSAGLLAYQDPYNGTAGPVIDVIENRAVKFTADNARLDGYVARSGVGYDEGGSVRLAYEVRMDKFSHSLPLDAPAMFYVGFTDTDIQRHPDAWGAVANGIFVQHVRELLPWEPSMRASIQANRLESAFRNGDLEATSPSAAIMAENNKIMCGVGGVNNLANLWMPQIGNSAVASMGVNAYGSYTLTPGMLPTSKLGFNASDSQKAPTTPKVDFNAADLSWSSELHMAHGGSTHNVYVDWYHYAGKAAFIVLVLFLGTLLVPLLLVTWSRRKSPYWPLLVAASLQVAVIVAAMYAQPYWWLRYYWVVFGLAAGLMIHPEFASSRQTNSETNRMRQ